MDVASLAAGSGGRIFLRRQVDSLSQSVVLLAVDCLPACPL